MKKLNKKMLLSIVAGVLVTVVIIGAGTYAWFTGRANTSGETFKTARVEISTDGQEHQAYSFANGHYNTLEFQKLLELWAGTGSNDQDIYYWLKAMYNTNDIWGTNPGYPGIEGDFDAMYAAYEDSEVAFATAKANFVAAVGALKTALDPLPTVSPMPPNTQLYTNQLTLKTAMQAPMGLVLGNSNDEAVFSGFALAFYNVYNGLPQNVRTYAESDFAAEVGNSMSTYSAFTTALADLQSKRDVLASSVIYQKEDNKHVTPGSFLVGKYAFENTSNIPVYFRVKDTVTENIDTNTALTVIATLNDYQTVTNLGLINGGDGWLYCMTPVNPDPAGNPTPIKIGVIAYVPGALNADDNNTAGLMEEDISFDGAEVEIIQATNNAAALSGWTPFVPAP